MTGEHTMDGTSREGASVTVSDDPGHVPALDEALTVTAMGHALAHGVPIEWWHDLPWRVADGRMWAIRDGEILLLGCDTAKGSITVGIYHYTDVPGYVQEYLRLRRRTDLLQPGEVWS